jgi:dTDP-4-dehydrorhamnose reductase
LAEGFFELGAPGRRPLVKPIASEEFPAVAARPKNSRLSNERLSTVFGLQAPRWRDALALCVATL